MKISDFSRRFVFCNGARTNTVSPQQLQNLARLRAPKFIAYGFKILHMLKALTVEIIAGCLRILAIDSLS